MQAFIKLKIASLFVITWWLITPTARADESYYVMFFAQEGAPNVPRLAHTFAAFIKVEHEEDMDPADYRIETHTISWLPAHLDPQPILLRRPEPGTNLTLKESLDWGISRGGNLSAWGPFPIKKELYVRALKQIDRLNSGRVLYKATDRNFRPDTATNCFHAVSDIVDGPLLDTGFAFGVPATLMVRDHLSRWFLNEEPQRWLRDRLKLDRYPIAYGE